MRLKSALRRGVAAAVIAGIVVSSGIPAYAIRWDIADGDITVKAGDEGTNRVTQGKKENVEDTDTVITGKSKEHTVTIDTSKGKVDVTFDDLKIDVSGKAEGDVSGKTEVDGSDDSPVDAGKAAVTVQGDHDATIELDGDNKLKSGSGNAGLEKNKHESKGTLTIKATRARTAPSPLRAAKAAQASAEERREPAATSPSGAAPSRLWAAQERPASATV